MRTLIRATTLSVLFGAALVGCEEGTSRVLGEVWDPPLVAHPEPHLFAPLVVPESAAVNEETTILVHTGGNGCSRKGDAEVVLDGLLVSITPYDRRISAEACTLSFSLFTHEVRVTFDQAGTATVVLHARDGRSGEVVEVTKTFEVHE